MPRKLLNLLIVCGALLLAAADASAQRRIALVIGNAAYENTPALANPLNDAEDMAAALRQVGFTVIFERDGSKRSMEQAIAQFARQARESDAALFYYAGHGFQFRGQNYLMPVDAKLEDEFSLAFEMARVDDVMTALNQTRGVKILILDACRNNPLADRLRRSTTRDVGLTRGLARIDTTQGVVVAYATQADQVAADGTGRNSPFTAALVRQLGQAGLEIGTLFRRVAAEVHHLTGGRQRPELHVSLFGDFYFVPTETDVQAWSRLRLSQNPAELKDFIARHGTSPLSVDARERLAVVERVEELRRERERLERELAAREQAAREQAARDQVAREQTVREQAARELAARELAARERAAREIAAREQAAREQAAREQAARELAAREQAAREQVAREQAARERAAREQAALEQAAREARAKLEEERRRQREQEEKAAAAARTQAPVQTALLTAPPDTAQPAAAPSGTTLAREIKKELQRVGCYVGRLDDQWGTPEVRQSVAKFVKHASLGTARDDPTADFLEAIRGKSGRVCPLECGAGTVERNGTCIAKQCPKGSVLNAKGACEKDSRTKTASRPSDPAPPKSGNPTPQSKGNAGGGGKGASMATCHSAVRAHPANFQRQAYGAAVRRCRQGGTGAI
jgi:hypothetical protein